MEYRYFSKRFIQKCWNCSSAWTDEAIGFNIRLRESMEVQRQHVRMFFSHTILYRDLGKMMPTSI